MTTKAKLGLLLPLTAWIGAGCLDQGGEDDTVGDAVQFLQDDQAVADACAQKPKKEAVCHIPPGNPDNAHTICISVNAVDKHLLLHGDYLGPCDPGGQGGGGGEAGGGGNGTGQGGGPSGSGGGGSFCGGELTPCTTENDCEGGAYCESGCCVTPLQ